MTTKSKEQLLDELEDLGYRYPKFSRFEIDEAIRKHKIIIVTEGFRYDYEE